MRGTHFIALVAVAFLLAAVPPAAAEDVTVVELFTSQGCSSCPPADAQLRELSKEAGIVALSLHVNYWDYIGWKDPFASATTTERQHLYASSLKQRFVYTPEMVIDGYTDINGANPAQVKSTIAKARSRDRLRLKVEASVDGGKVKVSIPAADGGKKASVWLFEIDREHTTQVARGENGGRTLVNANVVRSLKKIGEWDGDAVELTADLDEAGDRDACAIVIQEAATGPVLGATLVSMH